MCLVGETAVHKVIVETLSFIPAIITVIFQKRQRIHFYFYASSAHFCMIYGNIIKECETQQDQKDFERRIDEWLSQFEEDSPYTLQQWALCLASFKHYQDAFIKIDKAISLMPNNFSFRNSQAIILFESNKEIGSADAIGCMEKAMDTLKMCYMDDKRKIYHAQKFAEFAIYFHDKYDRNDYLENAWQWISEIIQEDSSPSHRTLRIRDKLMSIKSKL